jgi:hypothetical protein
MDSNYSLLQDLYLCVSATRPKNMDNLLIFLDQLMDMEEDVWDIDDLHDPEFNSAELISDQRTMKETRCSPSLAPCAPWRIANV